MLHEIAKTNQVLSDHLEFSANTRVKYTSPDIQNELIRRFFQSETAFVENDFSLRSLGEKIIQ
jgi:hypothetical protein